MQAVNTGYGLIGLDQMGRNTVRNLLAQGQRVVVYDRSHTAVDEMVREGAVGAQTLAEMAGLLARPRIIWLMVAAGQPVDEVLFGPDGLSEHLSPGDVIIDAGDTFYRDSIRRAAQLTERHIHLLDCGAGGGLEGARNGMCLMIGGSVEGFQMAQPLFHLLAVEDGYARVGPSGAGHFVKMVHNAIETGCLQALGEGIELLAQGPFALDLPQVTELWQHGSAIRSWLLDLAARALAQDPHLETVSAEAGDGDTGARAIEEGWKAGAPMAATAVAMAMRVRSHDQESFAGRVAAAVRREYGHETAPARAGQESVIRNA